MRALSKLIGALVVVSLVLAFGPPAGSPGPAAAQDTETAARTCDCEGASPVGVKGDRCIHKLCKELIQAEKLALRCLREEVKEKDKRDVKHLRVIVKHLAEAIKECRRADKD